MSGFPTVSNFTREVDLTHLVQSCDPPPESFMHLRDWFAGLAIQAMLTGHIWDRYKVVESAYSIADAMMEKRKQYET